METAIAPCLVAETEELLVAYETRGPADGPPVLLLHGWPDDVRCWDAVATALAAAGHRTIAPYLRGFGPTRFRDPATPRVAQAVTLALDAVGLLDALHVERATVVGHDWGGRLAYVLAALWPERVERLVTLSVPYLTSIPPGSRLDPRQQQAYWYQWFFGSERGREALRDNRRELCRYLWQTWAPSWHPGDEEFEATAAAWDNPDWVDITLHSYRVRWGNAPKDPRFAAWETRLERHPPITVPTVLLHGQEDGASLPRSTEGQENSFTAGYRREVLPGVGHFVPRERPAPVVAALLGEHGR